MKRRFVVHLHTGSIHACLLLKDFGAENGMLIVTDFSIIEPIADELVALGCGFSTLSEPSSSSGYDRDAFIEMLNDWGWSGPEEERPAWCLATDDNKDEP